MNVLFRYAVVLGEDVIHMVRDEELCLQLREGDEVAMELLVARHYKTIFAFLCRHTGDVHAACDLTQECFIRICTNIRSYRYPDAFLPWAFTIAHNLYRDWRTSAYQRREALVEPPPNPHGTVDFFERYVQRAEITQALAQLEDHHRSALILRFYHDLTIEQIAQITGVPQGTVKSRLSTAICRLRRLLETQEEARHGTR